MNWEAVGVSAENHRAECDDTEHDHNGGERKFNSLDRHLFLYCMRFDAAILGCHN